MGMFDDITCRYPLPIPGANDLRYQTKDTPSQFLDQYEIREDGTLWVEEYDTEDRSLLTKWEREHPGEEPPPEVSGLRGVCGMMTRVNKRWVRCDMSGDVRFYDIIDAPDGGRNGWLEWGAVFVNGELKDMRLVEHREPTPRPEEAAKE